MMGVSTDTASSKAINIALLVADTPPDPVVQAKGNYLVIYNDLFQRSLAALDPAPSPRVSLNLIPFDIVNEQAYPTDSQLAQGLFPLIVITGSASSVAGEDAETVPWIAKLMSFIPCVMQRHPEIRWAGFCWGHQAIARAMGGTVESNGAGWELGVYDCQLTEEGRKVWGSRGAVDQGLMPIVDENERDDLRLHQVHKDHVVSLPPGFHNLASTPLTNIQSLCRYYPEATESAFASEVQVLTLQGHPEFDRQIVELLIDAKTSMGPVPRLMVEEARRRAMREDHEGLRAGKQVLRKLLGI